MPAQPEKPQPRYNDRRFEAYYEILSGDHSSSFDNGSSSTNVSLSTNHGRGASRNFTHFAYSAFRVGAVKDRRPCYQPITPRPNHFRQIVQVYATVNLDGKL